MGVNEGLVTHALGGDSESTNVLYSLQTKDADQLHYYHEYGGGLNESVNWNYVFSKNQWYHVGIVRNTPAKTVDFYVNGSHQQTFNFIHDPTGGTSGILTIGCNPSGSLSAAYCLDAIMDDVRIYNRALTLADVQELYASTGSTPNPVMGDVTGDGDVNILDVQACINHVLGVQDWDSAADVNGDGNANVIDVQDIENLILH